MATRITDVLVPELWYRYLREQTAENSRLYQSGAVVRDGVIDENIANGGNLVNLPFWQDLGSDETVDTAQGDNPDTDLSPGKIESDQQAAVVLRRVVSFAAADLAGALAGDDPMQVALDRIAPFWDRRYNAAALSTIAGALGAIDEESPTLVGVHDVSVSSGTAVPISADAVIDARITALGDKSDDLTLIFVHSKVYGQLQKNNLIDFIPDARGEAVIPTYLGMQVVVSDTLPTTASETHPTYVSYLAGPGALREGETMAKVPVAIERQERQASGAGVEYFFSRRDFVLHPLGFKFSGSVSNAGPLNAALAEEGNWTRAFERKNIPLVGLKTNG